MMCCVCVSVFTPFEQPSEVKQKSKKLGKA